MKQTGHILRENREKSGLTIQEVSLALKINPKTIKAMEDGDLTQLPPRTFLRGFVHSYAQYLKLDLAPLMSVFNEETGVSTTTEPRPEADEKPVPTSPGDHPLSASAGKLKVRQPSRVTTITLSVLAVIILISIVVIKKTIDKYERESQVFAPPEHIKSLQLENKPAPTPTTTPPSSETLPTPQPTASKPPPPTPTTKVSPAADSLTPTKSARSKTPTQPAEPKIVVKSVEKSETPTATPIKTPTKLNASARVHLPQELIIEALGGVTVHVKIDGLEAQTFDMKPDQIRTIKAKKSITLELSDGGAVSLIHNGKDTGVPGNLGSPLTLNFPQHP